MDIFYTLNFHPATAAWFGRTFKAPSPPQLAGWPEIAAGRRTLILAPTGSGKTLAAFLWCIDELFRIGLSADAHDFERNLSGVHTLYISPLKALNNDIHFNLQLPLRGITSVAEEMGIAPPHVRAAVRTGDTPANLRAAMVKKPPHILITTPESLYLLLTSERGRTLFRNLRYLIVDEIHAVCGNKRGVHLSLSLERLQALCEREPIRIGLSATQKPLERIAAYLGGLRYDAVLDRHTPRPVTIVDVGSKKPLEVRVQSPVQEWSNLPDATVWPLLIDRLYELIRSNRTTLVFVNMRAQTEKIARLLNEKHRAATGDPKAVLAPAHHGSISREMRCTIEARLKSGKIPAVIATASLELGIDIGSIDLVVQVQSPTGVSAALQRIGRSGHALDSRSRGVVIPLFQADLDDCLALTEAMIERDIEETTIPENALDVLAQQIVAEVAMHPRSRIELFRIFRGSYCYRRLSEAAFNQVIDMLAGRFGHLELRALAPRLTWDRVNDMLIARKGARLTAVRNGGTIADRGYYGVHLEGAGTRLGEVEEEFVFESKVGDIFFLGNNEWRINAITRDRIMVTPLASTKPRAPFWKAEPLFRDYSTSQKIGAFRQKLLADSSSAFNFADPTSIDALRKLLEEQQEKGGAVATDQAIVVEYYRDADNEPHVFVHAPFGGRVLGAWATALASILEKRSGCQVQYTYDDDGMLFRLFDSDEPPPFDKLLMLPFAELYAHLVETLEKTPMFLVRFRHNAARALLLQRSGLNQRIPLWLQRLRAADLLQAVRQFPDFPILVETYRDCLEDLFDIVSLEKAASAVRDGRIRVSYIRTPSPSPMTAGLTFRFLSEQMYDYDRFRAAGHAAQISSEFLADVLSRQDVPTIVTQELVQAAEANRQFLTPERRARDAEDLFAVIAALGPLTAEELTRRSSIDPQPWLDELSAQRRIVLGDDGWQTVEAPTPTERLRRLLRRRGPMTLAAVQQAVGLPPQQTAALLEQLYRDKEVVRGRLVIGCDEEQWCDRDIFAQLYRQAVAQRRLEHQPADRRRWLRFLHKWHRLGDGTTGVLPLIQQYAGVSLPLHTWERDLLPARLGCDDDSFLDDLRNLTQSGEIIAVGSQEGDGALYRVRLITRGQESMFSQKTEKEQAAAALTGDIQAVYQFLRENGACPHRDICDGTALPPAAVDEALSALARKSLVCCDDLPTFLAVLQRESTAAERPQSDWHAEIRRPWSTVSRPPARRQAAQRLSLRRGRWFLAASFAVMGKPMDTERQAEHQARLLLARYGVVVKEFYRRESGLLPWPRLFQVLKRMEWSGEIRRGYFIEGLSGVQFALPQAAELFQTLPDNEPPPRLLTVIDPALPFGGLLPWGLLDETGAPVSVTRAAANHLLISDRPLVYSENFALRLWTLAGVHPEEVQHWAEQVKWWLRLPEPQRPRKKIEIALINNQPAPASRYAECFVQHGFETDGDALVLWPSNI